MEELLQAISVVGFPIVAYGGMFWYMVQLNNRASFNGIIRLFRIR